MGYAGTVIPGTVAVELTESEPTKLGPAKNGILLIVGGIGLVVVSEPTKSGPAKNGAPLTVEGIGWVVVSEGTKLGPAKKGAPLTVGATGASSSAKTEAKRAVKAMVEYFIASGMES